MSFDLYVIELNHVPAHDEIGGLLEAFDDPDAADTVVGPRMAAFWQEIQSRYPTMGEGDDDKCPWSIYPSITERGPALCGMAIPSSFAERMSIELREMASRHGLTLYDPQSNAIFAPV